MKAQMYGNRLILWNVFDYGENDEERTVATFKDPNKAALYALEHKYSGVEMVLCRPEWRIQTED